MKACSNSVIDRVRSATASAHQALEDSMDAVHRLSDLSSRRTLIQRYYCMHAGAERSLESWLHSTPDLDFDARRRSPALMKDLQALHVGVPDEAELPTLKITNQAEALGVLYVLEGSTLGGRVIEKALTARGCDLCGLSFLDPYGSKTGERWRSFLQILERDGASDPQAVERGGVLGFDHARNCLVDAEITR